MIERLAGSMGTNQIIVQGRSVAYISAIHDKSLGASESDFTVAKKIGMTGEDHLAILVSRRPAKLEVNTEEFAQVGEKFEIEEAVSEDKMEQSEDETQSTLDSLVSQNPRSLDGEERVQSEVRDDRAINIVEASNEGILIPAHATATGRSEFAQCRTSITEKEMRQKVRPS